jgi:hypothetical protein
VSTSSLGFKDGRLGFYFGNLLFGLTLPSRFSNFASHTSFCHIDSGLVGGSFVGFARQKREVLRARSILELFDVGIVDA